jgi:hypothetical protein
MGRVFISARRVDNYSIFEAREALPMLLKAVFSFRCVFEDDEADMNRIAGGISIYMLIGLIWATLYFYLSLLDSQAFKGMPSPGSIDISVLNTMLMDLVYFNYVSLSTLGYGDVTPVSRTAQSLACLEAIAGVMYVAVLVAAMVGSYGNKLSTRA